MRVLRVLPLVVALALVSPGAGAGTRKFALVLGNNRGADPALALRWAERDAGRVHRVLLELGGFAREDAVLLLGADSDQVWTALRRIERKIADEARGPGDTTMLFIFYSGHAEGDALELGETSLRIQGLREFLRESAADVRLAFIDSCHSGRLVSTKGGQPGPEFEILVQDEVDAQGYAVVTSSSGNELSQESAEIRGAFFTHYLVSALRGAADESGDGKVTLSEAYKYVYARTLARTSATVAGSQHPMYDFQLQGRGEIVLTSTEGFESRIAVTSPEPGRLVLLDGAGESMVAETEIEADRPALLAVRPGCYLAYLLTRDNAVRVAEAEVTTGGRLDLGMNDFRDAALEVAVTKGGLFRASGPEISVTDRVDPAPAGPTWTHRLGAAALWRLWMPEPGSPSFGAAVQYRVEAPVGLEPSLRLVWARLVDAGGTIGHDDMSAAAGLAYVLDLTGLALRAGVSAGYEHVVQGGGRHTSGFCWLVPLGVEVPLGSVILSADAGIGGRAFQVAGEGWAHYLDAQVLLGLGWKWTRG